MFSPSSVRSRAVEVIACAGLALTGCATLPSSGPTARQIERGQVSQNQIGFRLVDIDAGVVSRISEAETASARPALNELGAAAPAGRNDSIGVGDVLTIAVYEVGVSLFGSGRAVADGFDPSARGETFPAVVVDRDGTIKLPYIGRLAVAGRTPAEVQTMIEQGLRRQSQNPQALVAVRTNLSNTIYVAGDVRRPGRLELTLRQERLLDAIANAGGASYSSEDTLVRINRGTQIVESRLGLIQPGGPGDIVLLPGDRIELIRRPRSFIVLGATSRVSQVPFETGELSLAEAVARAGGPSDAAADPSAVFLFRYDPLAEANRETPVIYRLNMMQPQSYFLAQRFAVRDKDVIYIANAAANQPAKLVGIINQLFSPFLTVRALTNSNN